MPKKKEELKLEYLFYGIGIVFLFSTIVYFAREYVFQLPPFAKTVILLCLVSVAYFTGEYLEEKNV